MQGNADIGVIGLAVMGRNLILNMNDHGYTVAAFNRTVSKVDDFLEGEAHDTDIIGAQSLPELLRNLKRPRRVMLMVKAGQAVDDYINHLIPRLDPEDIIIDGGNSLFEDTIDRTEKVESHDLLYVGTGVSGGEEGARHGPSLMPGGSAEAWPHIQEIFQDIAAKVDGDTPCCDWVGGNGAGHYVKMVHNAIEYGDMQLICEAYSLMRDGLGMTHDEMHEVFARWNEGDLDSYLIQITRDILAHKDEDGEPLVEKILDAAGQKGTGKWTVINAAEMGMPVTLMGEAVFARCLSSLKDDRERASQKLRGPKPRITRDRTKFLEDIRAALYASKIVSYAQGFMLLRTAAREYSWKLNYGNIALMWRGGCIIRSRFLGRINEAYTKHPRLRNLMLDTYFKREIRRSQKGWRNVVAVAAKRGIPLPAMSSALAFFDGYRSARLPHNLLQAQRDYFGAHTYERIDHPRGKTFHTNWTGRGGTVASGTYNA
ncbi:MAG: decarboxylating NADP(+)-dependent phosphogluconate dehydrogenase [Verrucomicrobiota bacterium]|nr:decarboxylating NADP(+)-dependent phosphogluconate dehydrogenase [Verrucomicrobiota bacterium]